MVGNSGILNYNDLETCEDKWDIMKINDYTAIKRTHPQKNRFMNWIYTCHEAQPFYRVAQPNMWLWWDRQMDQKQPNGTFPSKIWKTPTYMRGINHSPIVFFLFA